MRRTRRRRGGGSLAAITAPVPFEELAAPERHLERMTDSWVTRSLLLRGATAHARRDPWTSRGARAHAESVGRALVGELVAGTERPHSANDLPGRRHEEHPSASPRDFDRETGRTGRGEVPRNESATRKALRHNIRDCTARSSEHHPPSPATVPHNGPKGPGIHRDRTAHHPRPYPATARRDPAPIASERHIIRNHTPLESGQEAPSAPEEHPSSPERSPGRPGSMGPSGRANAGSSQARCGHPARLKATSTGAKIARGRPQPHLDPDRSPERPRRRSGSLASQVHMSPT